MTAQVPDSLIYGGNSYALFSNPLEPYFEERPSRPNFVFHSTDNWRALAQTTRHGRTHPGAGPMCQFVRRDTDRGDVTKLRRSQAVNSDMKRARYFENIRGTEHSL